jgi:hypothetical protein
MNFYFSLELSDRKLQWVPLLLAPSLYQTEFDFIGHILSRHDTCTFKTFFGFFHEQLIGSPRQMTQQIS